MVLSTSLSSCSNRHQVSAGSVHLSIRRAAVRHTICRIPRAVVDRYDGEVTLEDGEHHCCAYGAHRPCEDTHNEALASATWVIAGSQPRNTLRDALSRSPSMPGGKTGGWVAVVSVLLGAAKAAHWSVVKRCKACNTCRGYGIKRCNLCGASGAISWTGKWDHIEPCPACVGMRFSSCPDCGGLYHKPLFQHVSRNAGLQASQDQALTTVDVISPMVD